MVGFFHHFGSFLLLAACVLLLITTITAPVIKNLAILRVDLQNGDTVNFGTFGYCILRYVSIPSPFPKSLHHTFHHLSNPPNPPPTPPHPTHTNHVQ